MKVFALIVAGGRGARFGGHTPKQFAPLAGEPVLSRTLAAFDSCAEVDAVVLVAPAEALAYCRDTYGAAAGGGRKLTAVVPGGATRQESVRCGLAALVEQDGIVAVHDAVRPLVEPEHVAACIAAARIHGAAVLAVPAWDTLKRAAPEGAIIETLPREGLWLAQTPQAFRLELIREAHRRAAQEGYAGTDDAELVERLGHRVVIVPGSRRNLKITTAEDLLIAEAILRARGGGAR